MTTPFFDLIPWPEVLKATCLQGEIDISYSELVSIFGPPNSEGDGHKVDAEWLIRFNQPDGPVYATIYNYKTGKNYLGRTGQATSRIRDWHIGGESTLAVTLVKQAILITPRRGTRPAKPAKPQAEAEEV